MRWLLLFILLFGCQQDEIVFRTVKKAPHKEEQQIETQLVETKECPQTCTPPSSCDRSTGTCTGRAIKKENSTKLNVKEGDTTLVFDNRTGRLYGKSHENY